MYPSCYGTGAVYPADRLIGVLLILKMHFWKTRWCVMPNKRTRAEIDLIVDLEGLGLEGSEVDYILRIADDSDAAEKANRYLQGRHDDALGLSKAFLAVAAASLVGACTIIGAMHGSMSNGFVLAADTSLLAVSAGFAMAAVRFYRKAEELSRRSFYAVKALQRYRGES